ncbi:hypothetical protein TNCV_1121101 [Trichonephila clavipes]|uniref:Uncharacterized protein n=1 Tax=Trichonephila clavipes TaxID=2585209 RepID=A0A8X6SWZ7_TRICX|nr:hypothetical protein TNCV_1121101 [Trichonephila clavipes]
MDRISIYEALAKRNEIDPFLKRMVTGYEKWVTYNNIVRKRSWSSTQKVGAASIALFATKGTDSQTACHEFDPRTAEDTPCRGGDAR